MSQTPAAPAYAEAQATRELNWVTILFLGLTPVAAIALGWAHWATAGFSWVDVFVFFLFYELAGLSITAGYHRLFSHKTYEAGPFVQAMFLLFGAAAFENSLMIWGSDHRYHHQHTDRDGDPYNINKGFFWAHIGWMFYKTPDREFRNIPDLKKNKLVLFQHKHYMAIAIFACFLLPMAVGACFGLLGGLIWGGLIRMVVLHHVTFMINSGAHYFGKKRFDTVATARDSHWVGALSFGEGYHSYHHAYPSDYRNGIHWYDIDQGKWLISGLRKVGLAWDLKRVATEVRERRLRSMPTGVAIGAGIGAQQSWGT